MKPECKSVKEGHCAGPLERCQGVEGWVCRNHWASWNDATKYHPYWLQRDYFKTKGLEKMFAENVGQPTSSGYHGFIAQYLVDTER